MAIMEGLTSTGREQPILVNADGSLVSTLEVGTLTIGKVQIDQTTPGTSNGVQVTEAIPAGTNLIGKVSLDQTTYGTTNAVFVGGTSSVSQTPTVTASSAYTANNEVGGLLTFASITGPLFSGVIESVRVSCKSVQTAGFKLYVFNTNPTNSTWTDKSAPAINVADIPFLIGVYTLGTSDSGLGTHTLYTTDGISKAFVGSSTSLYGILVTTGTPTFTATSDITVTLNVLKD